MAFAVFRHRMTRLRDHFDASGRAINEILDSARQLIQFLQPQFFDFLGDNDLLCMFFCYRWVLLDFKREFPFFDVCIRTREPPKC